MNAPVAERSEEPYFVFHERTARREVDVGDFVRRVAVGPEAVTLKNRVRVVAPLHALAGPRGRRRSAPAVAAGLGDHVEEHPGGGNGDVVRAGRDLNVV